jgi:hypothetical protein
MYEMEGPRLCPAALASRLLGHRVLRGGRRLSEPRHQPVTRPSDVPRVAPEADPVFSGEEFLLRIEGAAQGFSARSSRFFSHPQDICCLSPVHVRFPLRHTQARPQKLWITPQPDRSSPPERTGAVTAGLPTAGLPAGEPPASELPAGRGAGTAGDPPRPCQDSHKAA